jgi:hypothetical protein
LGKFAVTAVVLPNSPTWPFSRRASRPRPRWTSAFEGAGDALFVGERLFAEHFLGFRNGHAARVQANRGHKSHVAQQGFGKLPDVDFLVLRAKPCIPD